MSKKKYDFKEEAVVNDKKDLEERINELEAIVSKQNEQIMDSKIKKHKDGYIHIPFSWDGFYRGLAFLGSGLLVLLNFYALHYFWNYFNIWNCFLSERQINQSLVSTSQLFFLYPLFAWWFSIWLFAFCLKAWHDGNWENVGGLVVGLVVGLVGGLVGGLVVGLVGGLVGGLVVGLVVSLVVGLVVSLVVGLVVSLVVGFIEN